MNTWGTLVAVGSGLIVSLIVGIVLGFAIPLFPWAENTLDPLVDATYAMPVTMLIPIIGVYTGLGFQGRVFVVFTYVAMVIVIGTATGVREVDKGHIETARSFGAKGFAETTITPTAAAIANAIYDAVGVRIRELPITSEKIYNSLNGRQKGEILG